MTSEQVDTLGWIVLFLFGLYGSIYGVGQILTRKDAS